jgi:hypothetical protein
MIYTESEKDSLDRFMRRESPLTKFYRSVRGEGQAASGTSAENDPFAGIAIDDLPDDLKEKLTKAKGSFATLQSEAKTAKEKADAADKLSKDHQARADRNFELLRKHNLVDSVGKPTVEGNNADDALTKALTDELVKTGLTPEAAATYAKIQLATNKVLKPELFKEIGANLNPMAGAVGEMYAGKLLAEAMLPKNDPDNYFTIPEIETNVKTNLDMLVKGGATINAETINNLKSMAFGQYFSQLKPEQRTEFMNRGQQQQSTQFGTGGPNFGSTGNFATLQRQQSQQGQAPAAANTETADAIRKTMDLMVKGTGVKLKGTK